MSSSSMRTTTTAPASGPATVPAFRKPGGDGGGGGDPPTWRGRGRRRGGRNERPQPPDGPPRRGKEAPGVGDSCCPPRHGTHRRRPCTGRAGMLLPLRTSSRLATSGTSLGPFSTAAGPRQRLLGGRQAGAAHSSPSAAAADAIVVGGGTGGGPMPLSGWPSSPSGPSLSSPNRGGRSRATECSTAGEA